jgi:hypothetical protein
MRAALARREREGLSWAALAEATGIPLSTLRWWQRKVDETEEDDAGKGFVELLVGDGGAEAATDGYFELVLESGALIRVPQQFDSGSLAELLAVLGSRGC